MKQLKPFHHYNRVKYEIEDPIEMLEEQVVTLLRSATVGDELRDSSIAFELKHSAGVLQFGRLLAKQRGLPPRSAAAGALLHDVYVIVEGRYKDHAHLGAPLARSMMEATGGFSEVEIAEAEEIVYNHSDKDTFSADPLIEFGKDADVLDSFLYPGAFDYYLLAKPLPIFVSYLRRAKLIWSQLSLPSEPGFDVLDTFVPGGWLTNVQTLDLHASPPNGSAAPAPFAVFSESTDLQVALPAKGVVTQEVARLAVEAMECASRTVEGGLDVVLVWPAIGRWECLSATQDASRVATLGLPLPGAE